MNFNTIASFQGGTLRNQIASQTLAATGATAFLANTDSGTGVPAVLTIPQGTSIAGSTFPQDPNTNAALSYRTGRQGIPINSPAPSHSAKTFDSGRPFLLRLCGVLTPANAALNTITLAIYCGTTVSGGTAIATTTALTGSESSTTAASFVLESQCFWDSTSQQLYGQFWWGVNFGTPSYHVWQANSNAITSVALSGLNFIGVSNWGASAGGVIAVSEFSLSQL